MPTDEESKSNLRKLRSRPVCIICGRPAQALEIAKRHCSGREPEEPLFPIVDARKTLSWINARAGTTVQGHGLRATFASIAEELVSGGALKRMPPYFLTSCLPDSLSMLVCALAMTILQGSSSS